MPRNGAFILPGCPQTSRLLLQKRSDSAEYSPGVWFAFGGTSEPGELAIETATREFVEETGIPSELLEIEFEPLVFRMTDHHGTALIYLYLGRVSDELLPEVDSESAGWSWTSLKHIADMELHPVMQKILSDETMSMRLKTILC